ncbi:MAG: hypothetical protein ACRELA_11295 [Candidatus Rokuibacteriota bacterium]
MNERCWCGDHLRHFYESWACARCRRPCCPACAEHDGSRVTCLVCHGARESGRIVAH